MRIAPLARSLDIGQDQLEKRFRRVVGASPKRLASILRLQRALRSFRSGVPLSELAPEAGYYDQAHLTREFRAATGAAPGTFFREVAHCWRGWDSAAPS